MSTNIYNYIYIYIYIKLADAFIQSDVQRKEQSSYEQ